MMRFWAAFVGACRDSATAARAKNPMFLELERDRAFFMTIGYGKTGGESVVEGTDLGLSQLILSWAKQSGTDSAAS